MQGGLFQEAVTFRRVEGESLNLSLRGPIAEAKLDYRLTDVWFVGLSYALARVEASGSLVNRLRAHGIGTEPGTVQVLSLAGGVNF